MESTANCVFRTELATFDRPRSEQPVTLGIVADPHVAVDETEHQKLYKPTTMLERAVADCNRREVDYLFSVGDLTREGVPEEYDVLDDVLEPLDAPFGSVPGNHDVPKEFDSHDGLPITRFSERYAPDGLPFAIDLEDLTVVGLDSASAASVLASHDGYVPEVQVAWLDDVLDGATNVLVLVHHNLPGTLDQFHEHQQVTDTEVGSPPVLRQPNPLVDVLSDYDVPLVLSGHLHIPGLANTGSLREILVPSTCTYPQGYLLVEVDSAGTSVHYVPVATQSEATEAYHERCALRPLAAQLTEMAAIRLATAPLSHEAHHTESRQPKLEY